MARLSKAAAVSAAAVLSCLLMGCDNSFDILSTVTDQVKTANARYLIIVSTVPAANAQNVDPTAPIVIVFDRDVDATAWRAHLVVASGGASVDTSGWTSTYNPAIFTLTLAPSPILPSATITFTMAKSLTAVDGCPLREEVSWSFETIAAVPGAPVSAPTVTALNQRLFVEWSAVSGATSYEVWYNSANMSGTASRAAAEVAATSYTITALSNGTQYWVWIKAENSAGTSDFGPPGSGTPHVTPPFLSTKAVTNVTGAVTTFSADSGGVVTDNGGGSLAECGVCWASSPNPTHDGLTAVAAPENDFTAQMTDLAPVTTYYVRAFARNDTNTEYGYGDQVSFTTPSLTPLVTTSAPSPASPSTANGGGTVTSEGGTPVTARGICWGTGVNPTTSGSHTTDGSGSGAFSSIFTGLGAKTTYHVRAYATNSLGTSYGGDVQYTHPGIPELTTSSSFTDITDESFVAYGTITYSGGYGMSSWGFCWNTTGSPTLADNHATGSMDGAYIYGLNQYTTYHVRAYATNTSGTGYGNDVTVTTYGWPIITATTAATSVTGSSAVSGGTGISIGDGTSTFYDGKGLCWGASPSPTRGANEVRASTYGAEDFSCTITGLTANTTYHVRAWATNKFGTGYGPDVSFTTTAAAIPTIVNVFQNIGGTGVTSGGEITSDGGAAVTARGVCWGTSANPTTSGSHTTDGSGSGVFASSVTGLSTLTTYHLRAYATNSAGTAYSADVQFNSGRTFGSSYAGGLVFYNDGSGHGLVCATADQSSAAVWELSPYTSHGTGTAIGTGLANTAAIVATDGAGTYAAKLCDDYTDGTYSDWFLPSDDELNLMYLNLVVAGLGGLNGNYWSSSEANSTVAVGKNLWGSGNDFAVLKSNTNRVRAVSAF